MEDARGGRNLIPEATSLRYLSIGSGGSCEFSEEAEFTNAIFCGEADYAITSFAVVKFHFTKFEKLSRDYTYIVNLI
jgi:hypothetical protein